MHFGRGLRGRGVIIGIFYKFFLLHVSEHVDHFKAIKVFSLRKKPEMVWLGVPPPPRFGKTPNFFRFFLVKASLTNLDISHTNTVEVI